MNAVCVQLDIAWEDKQANFAKVRSLLAAADVPRGALIVLPEMFSTGFSMDVEAVCESRERPAEGFLAALAADCGSAVLGGVVTRAADGRGQNEALLVGPDGGPIARYVKMHPFSYAGETEHYAPGDGPVVARYGGMTLSPLVCYDLRFPEAFRAAAAGGAELLVVIANWPEPRADHWRTLLRARAIENQAYVIGVNRTGADPNARYAGGSVVVDPRGRIVADAGDAERTISAQLDPAALRDYRREFPALKDMRRP